MPGKKININLAKSRGFCFGVRRALQIAAETIQKGKPIEMLGDIVHNEEIIHRLKQQGIRKISRLSQGKNKILLIRAHGCPKKIYTQARRLRYTIVDATCPMVKEIHRIVTAMEKKGYKIIVIGDKEHDEVRGIVGQIKKKAIVIDSPSRIPKGAISRIKKAAVVAQSTQNIDNVQKIVKYLEKHIPQLKFFNTICRPTQKKQEEIKTMPLENDIMIIIGSRHSANTKRLYQISKSLNKNTYWVQSEKDIKPEWLTNAYKIGITSGASTPDTITRKIIAHIKKSRV